MRIETNREYYRVSLRVERWRNVSDNPGHIVLTAAHFHRAATNYLKSMLRKTMIKSL